MCCICVCVCLSVCHFSIRLMSFGSTSHHWDCGKGVLTLYWMKYPWLVLGLLASSFYVLIFLSKDLNVDTHRCTKQHNSFIWREALLQIMEGYVVKFDSGPQEE